MLSFVICVRRIIAPSQELIFNYSDVKSYGLNIQNYFVKNFWINVYGLKCVNIDPRK